MTDFPNSEPADFPESPKNQNSKRIAFVGAGASANLYPLWGRLVELLGVYGREGFPKFSVQASGDWKQLAKFWSDFKSIEPAYVVEHIRKEYEKRSPTGAHDPYNAILRDIFSDRQDHFGRRYTFVHERIAAINNLAGVITLNYDDGLKHALRDKYPNKSAPELFYEVESESERDPLKEWLKAVERFDPNQFVPPI